MRMPYALVARFLREDPAGVIAAVGHSEAGKVHAHLVAHVPGTAFEFGAEAIIEVGDLEDVAGPIPSLRIPVQWHGAGESHLLPEMVAHLEAFPATANDTELAIVGEYTPPLGALGAAVDHALMHRVASDAANGLLEAVVHEIKNRRSTYEFDGPGHSHG